MKISDNIIQKYLDVKSEQIEYTVNDATTRVYIYGEKLPGYHYRTKLVLEMKPSKALVYLEIPGTSTNNPASVLLASIAYDNRSTAEYIMEQVTSTLMIVSKMFSAQIKSVSHNETIDK